MRGTGKQRPGEWSACPARAGRGGNLAAQRARRPSGGRGSSGRRRTGRRTGKRAAWAAPLVFFCALALAFGAGYAWHRTGHADPAASLSDPRDGGPVPGRYPATAAKRASVGTSAAPGKGKPSPTGPAPSVPQSGTGVFSTAHASGSASGHGTIRRYKVEVEGGIDLSASGAAKEIAGILADPRGWEADGHDGFQLVSSGPADFVIKIATPDTTDAICGEAGLDTGGEVNCDVGATVVVNLKRWILGSPEFHGPIHDYRALIINHEVGHRIGHGHEGCPGKGKLAPVMMQQIKGLHGCIANAWPYDSHGRYIQGPPA
jgi:hypothetical protein